MTEKKQNPEDEQIVLPLFETIDLLLGDADYKEMPRKFAEQLYAKCRNKRLVFVQFPEDKHSYNIFGQRLQVPLVWRLEKYYSQAESRVAAKKRSEEERQQRFIFLANVEIAYRAIVAFSELEEKFARPLAIDKVKKGQEKHIIAMGGKPFIKRFEDIP